MASLVDQILKVEGTGQNPNSSAVGPGQFIGSTWLNMVKKYRPDLADGRSDSQILGLRTSLPALGPEMTGAYARENQGLLEAAGFNPSAGNTYLAHFAGPGGAIKVLSADPGTPVAQLLPAAVSANPFLRGMTAKGLQDWAERKMAGADGTDIPSSPQNASAPSSGPVRGLLASMLGQQPPAQASPAGVLGSIGSAVGSSPPPDLRPQPFLQLAAMQQPQPFLPMRPAPQVPLPQVQLPKLRGF